LRECPDYVPKLSRSIPGKCEATNFYIWDSEDAAKAFFTDAILERVTGLYGVRPDIEFVQIATLVENARGSERI
jgi:hypothetical protein